MNFLFPAFLGFFLLLLPVFALYFLKSRPIRKVVPSNVLWKVVFSRIKPNSFWQKFQNSLFLLLQIIAISLVVLALAQPLGLFPTGVNRIIILDVSASMLAEDILPNRFSAAVARAGELCSGFNGRVAIYTLGDHLIQAFPFSENPNEAKAFLKGISPQHSATPSSERFLRMVRDLEGLEPDEIFILTDTLSPNFPSDFLPRTSVTVEIFAKEEANVAIVGGEANLDQTKKVIGCRLLLLNCNKETINVSLKVEENEIPGFPVVLDLEPQQKRWVSMPPLPAGKNTIVLRAPEGKNFSKADDRWYICDPGLKPKIGIIAQPWSILFRLKNALPLVEFVPFESSEKIEDFAAVLCKGDVMPNTKNLPGCVFLQGKSSLRAGDILPWESDNPLVKFTNWDAVPVEALFPGDFPGMPIIESVGGKLVSEEIFTGEKLPVSHIWVGMDPDHPSLRGEIFLPVFLFNLVEYLLKDKFPCLSYPVGHPSLWALWKGNPPSEAGFHTLPENPQVTVALNLQSPSEAVISPGYARNPSFFQATPKMVKEHESSPWRGLLALGCLVFLGEWYLFMRRT